jgi:hypothetical protein
MHCSDTQACSVTGHKSKQHTGGFWPGIDMNETANIPVGATQAAHVHVTHSSRVLERLTQRSVRWSVAVVASIRTTQSILNYNMFDFF